MGASQSSLTPNEGSRPLQDQQEQCGRCGCACAQTREPHAGPPSFPPAQFLHSASAAWPSDKGPTCPLQPPARPIPASLNSSYMGFPWPLPQPFPSHDATSTSIGSFHAGLLAPGLGRDALAGHTWKAVQPQP